MGKIRKMEFESQIPKEHFFLLTLWSKLRLGLFVCCSAHGHIFPTPHRVSKFLNLAVMVWPYNSGKDPRGWNWWARYKDANSDWEPTIKFAVKVGENWDVASLQGIRSDDVVASRWYLSTRSELPRGRAERAFAERKAICCLLLPINIQLRVKNHNTG